MFIKRSVINEIGYFDEVLFGKGYGEENDFVTGLRSTAINMLFAMIHLFIIRAVCHSEVKRIS